MSRIIRLQAENFKRLVAVDIQADGNLIVLSGKNRQGKTSILDAILAVLKGRKFARETSQTIRDGQSEAWVRIEIGDDAEHIQYIATRRWTDEGSGTLTLESSDHARYSSPQKLLDEIVGEVSFDPMSFLDLDAAKQVEALGKALGPLLPFDLAELTALHNGTFEQRTGVNRQVRDLEGDLAGKVKPNDETPAEEVSGASILAEFEAARQHNAAIDRQVNDLAALESGLERVKERVARLETELAEAREGLATAEDAYDRQLDTVHSLELIDTDDISARLAAVEQTNAAIRAGQDYRRALAALEVKRAESEALTAKLAELDKQKADGIAAAKFPVPELSFNDDGVTFNGRAFSQASTEERIRASFGIAITANPALRVCRIDKGEALDSESLKVLAALADEHDMQVWISRVDESGSIGFVIEEGRVAA